MKITKTKLTSLLLGFLIVISVSISMSNKAYAGLPCVFSALSGKSCPIGFVCLPDAQGRGTCYGGTEVVGNVLRPLLNIVTAIGIASGFFVVVLAGYKIMTSQGNPQAMQEGKESIGSAITGLIFVLLSASILRILIKILITGSNNPF